MEHLRVSDGERERVAAFLHERCLEGRLDTDELDDRVAAALGARTRGTLEALVGDLPGGADALPWVRRPPAVAAGAAPARRRARALSVLALLAALVVVLPLVLPEELVLLAAVAAAALVMLSLFLVVSLAPWLAAGAGAVWALKRFREARRLPPGPGRPPHAPGT